MRRTKQQSEETRQRILAAARRVFARRGVTRTTMEHVATDAGVTRGAIYWHFANKTALFDAMRVQVSVPLIDRSDYALLTAKQADPLVAVERFLRNLLDAVVTDADTRQTFRIMMLKCEYVDELEPELTRQSQHWRELEAKLVKVYGEARRAGTLRNDISPALAALDTCAFVSGLMRLWLIDEQAMLIRARAARLIAAHVAGRRTLASRSGRQR